MARAMLTYPYGGYKSEEFIKREDRSIQHYELRVAELEVECNINPNAVKEFYKKYPDYQEKF